MIISINKSHKSITDTVKFELPSFSVLTGKNGSGKTHLLEALSDISKSRVYSDEKIISNVRYISFNGLNPNIQESCDPSQISQFIKQVWNEYSNIIQRYKGRDKHYLAASNILQQLSNPNSIFIKHVIEATNKQTDKITEDDIYEHFDVSYMGQDQFFTAQFALIFKIYHKRLIENDLNELYYLKGEAHAKAFLSKEDFEFKHGPKPWDFVNIILSECNIPYKVNSPLGSGIDTTFKFKLIDKEKGFEVSSSDLSTGEKVLMSLALAIYNTGGDIGKPDLLLLDEPDAGLHPSMSKMMVEVLHKNIVIDNGIPTIITTHSPTTIIAADGISIYQMERGKNIPTKISTQTAVEILSSDIPFLRISNDKRRQVFVESKHDVNYYELLTNIYARSRNLMSEPIFIPARTSVGSSCSDVISIVDSLSKNGNEQVFGIIDWDTTNKATGQLIVLGENDRYAIENYLLDPLLMGLLFIRETKKVFTDLGITGVTTYSEVHKLEQNDFQKIINVVLQDLGLNSTNLIEYELENGSKLQLSSEYMNYQGHDLEILYKKKYPFLNSYHQEASLKKDVIGKVINDHPLLAPKKLFDVLRNIK